MANNDVDSRLAARIKMYREQQNLSQQDLADLIGKTGLSVQANTIYKIETQRRKVTAAELVSIASALRVSVLELLDKGMDSAFVAKEKLLDFGMEALLTHERIIEDVHRLIRIQAKIRETVADYRDHFGEDPIWLAYVKNNNLRLHWEPLANWDGPSNYLNSWKELIELSGTDYLRDLGWADDRTQDED